MNEQAIQVYQQPTQSLALDAVGRKAAIDDLLNKVALVQEVMAKVMHEGEHYGKIPGCGDKPALFKAGAEKLGMTFRLQPKFSVEERDLGAGHREYSVTCTLSDGTQGVGSCNTRESKYLYRQAERRCPTCGKAAIIEGKAEFGGGWLCWKKKGGCGAKFDSADAKIISQPGGKVEHDNPADYYNTCLKMGKKRAHVDAIITATASSDIVTQDVEEMVQNAEAAQGAPPSPSAPSQAPVTKTEAPKKTAPAPATETYLPVVNVKMVTKRTGQKIDGTPWTAFFILLNDGINDLEVATFSKTLAAMAKTLAEKDGSQAEATIKPGTKQGSWELVSLLPKSEPKEQDDVPM